MKNLFLGAYWGPREESREACAQRLSAFMGDLAALHPRFTGWGEASGSPKKPRLQFEITPEGIAKVLDTNNNDVDGQPIVDLGFSLGCYTETEPEEGVVRIDATLGVFTPLIPNSILLKMRKPVIADVDLWEKIAATTIWIFNPDDVVITSDAYVEKRGGGRPREVGGWFTYKKGGEIIQNPAFLAECE